MIRSEFEKWLDENNMFMEIERKFNQEHNTYEYCAIRWIWESWQHQQSKVDELHKISVALNTETIRQREQVAYYLSKNAELQKRVDAAFRVLSQLNALDDKAHKRWKREACMFSQGESNAYEHAVRLLEQAFKGGEDASN